MDVQRSWLPERIKELEESLAQVTRKPRLARAILLRLGFCDGRPLTLQEVGQRLGQRDDPRKPILKERARQLIYDGVWKLCQSHQERWRWRKEPSPLGRLSQVVAEFYGLPEPPTITRDDPSLAKLIRLIKRQI